MRLFTAILVRPFTSTYLMRPSYSDGRNWVNASGVSYMWLSASNTGKSRSRDGMKNTPPCSSLSTPSARLTATVEVDRLTVVFPYCISARRRGKSWSLGQQALDVLVG